VMSVIFVYILLGPYRRLRAAVSAANWPDAGARLSLTRLLVATNLALGIATIAVATVGRAVL
jgi:hypothetical protein